MASANENRLVNDLREEVMDELRGEEIAVQIKVAFAVLATVIGNAIRRDPDQMKVALSELQRLMSAVQ